MMGLYNMGDVPFRHVYLHGLIRDAEGRKMTKSRGNVVDPLKVADKYGTDALRFTLATGGTPGNDFRLFDEKLESSRNFANKIWNAARFVIQSIGDEKVAMSAGLAADAPLEDRWIVSRLRTTARETNSYLDAFQINEAGRLLYDFFWNDYCDWYLEMAKVRLRDGDRSPLPVLAYVLQSSLRLLHPMMPFVTEAVWQHLRGAVEGLVPESIMIGRYPVGEGETDAEAESHISLLIDVVRAIRNIRAERGVDPARFVEVYVAADGSLPAFESSRTVVEALARVRPLHLVATGTDLPGSGVASAVLDGAQVALPLAGLLDLDVERRKLAGQLQEAEGEITRLEAKLADEQFRSKAPEHIIGREQDKAAAARTRAEGLRQRLKELG